MRVAPTAIVPFKPGPGAKLRLAHVLDADRRAALARALFDRVIAVLGSCGLRVIAVCASPLEPRMGVEVWMEEAPGLNASLRAALRRIGHPALIVPADLPELRREDVRQFLAEPGDVVVAPSRDGGTNGLLLRRALEPSFGPRSALAHLRSAHEKGYRARCVHIPGFERDVDDEAALTAMSLSDIKIT